MKHSARRALGSRAGLASLLMLAMLAAAKADELRLSRPVACVPGTDCWIVNYTDHDPGEAIRDYRCGERTYDGHNGTDFALRDLAAMANGVGVVAAAPGTVKATRDGMADTGLRDAPASAVKGRECGNGVLVAHSGGWETQYCHLRRGSVAVKPGDTVARGQRLGLVGLSGMSEFPHLHFSVRHDGRAIDPFLGATPFGACRTSADALWDRNAAASLVYEPVAIYNAGFSAAAPDPDSIRRGERGPTPARESSALVLWADMFGMEAGDRVLLRIRGPDGQTIAENERTIDKHYTRRFEYAGRRRPQDGWRAGPYRGEVVVTRGGSPPLLVRRKERIELR